MISFSAHLLQQLKEMPVEERKSMHPQYAADGNANLHINER